MEKLVLVNRSDQILGNKGRLACHRRPGELHRALAAFVVDDRGRILLTKRSKKKLLWPFYWENTCSSHPHLGESYAQAGERRLTEELGFTTPLRYVFKFYYQADYNSKLSEHEVCAVLVGRYAGGIELNPEEVADYKWIEFDKLKQGVLNNGFAFAPWLQIAASAIEKDKKWREMFL